MEFMISGTHYKKVYVVKVINTKDRNKWYYTKANQVYECTIEHINKKPFFRVDAIHKIPAEFCNIIETKTVVLYKKY